MGEDLRAFDGDEVVLVGVGHGVDQALSEHAAVGHGGFGCIGVVGGSEYLEGAGDEFAVRGFEFEDFHGFSVVVRVSGGN
ncbi:hypothetical protein GCM10027447_27250 [Glycomyces halotolerans]